MPRSRRIVAAGAAGPPGSRGRRAVLDWLDSRIDFERTPPEKRAAFGLTRMRRLLAELGRPQDAFPVVHVAGTKGKGSTVSMVAAMLSAAGHRTGRYLSPHVHMLEERIAVDGRPIGTRDLVRVFTVVIPVVEAIDAAARRRGRRGPTWFEVVTAAAFVHFARAGVDIAVLETGIGGRLDATNTSRPVVSVITSVSLDHMALLGRTVGRIAAEKAGIIKRGCPVVSGATHPAARRVITATAARRRAPLVQLGRDVTVRYEPAADPLAGGSVELVDVRSGATSRPQRYRIAMTGRHQAENAALAVLAARQVDARGLPVSEAAIVRGLAGVRLPARIERLAVDPLVIVDAAHNVASMESLLETLDTVATAGGRRVLVFAASVDKQIEAMLAAATGRFDHVVVTRYARNPRAAPVTRLTAACRAAGLRSEVVEPPAAALATARSLAGRSGLVCVAGSFFLAGEILGR